jgi:hypothetical protein
MSKRRIRVGLPVLCVTAAFVLMAFASSAAQAALPRWMLNTVNVPGDLTVTAVIASDKLTLLLSKAIGTTIAIDCKEQALVGNKLLLETNGKATASVEFKGCSTELGGKPSAGCQPIEPIVAGGELQVALHEGEPLIKVTNSTGTLARIEFNLATCTLPSSVPVKGTEWLLDCLGIPETEWSSHLVIEAKLAAEMLGGLKFGSEPAAIDGSLIIEQVKLGTSFALTFSILAD